MDVRQLRYALALAEHQHFGRAATAVGIAQPPLSKAIANLETELGALLFERSSRGVHPTAAGEALLARARRIVSDLEAAARDAQRAARGETGHLRIGFIGSALLSMLPPVLRTFRLDHPDVHLELEEMSSTEGGRAVVAGELDAAICRGTPRGRGVEDLITVSVSRDYMTGVVSTGHPLAGQSHVSVRQLRHQPLIVTQRDAEPAIIKVLSDALPEFSDTTVIATRDIQTIIGLAACGLGIGLGPQDMRVITRTDVAIFDLRPRVELPSLTMVFHPERRSPALSALLAVMAVTCPLARPALTRIQEAAG